MNKVIVPTKKAITIFLVFALGYYISNLLRAITETISPNLIFEFNLSAGDLGLLGGGYFLGVAAVQILLGYLLDNKGPK
jgi:sugar phosphate permease